MVIKLLKNVMIITSSKIKFYAGLCNVLYYNIISDEYSNILVIL